MLSVKEAQEKIINIKINKKKKKVPILESMGKILAEDILSDDFIPVSDNSAMDGFALKASDTRGASNIKPVKLILLEEDIPAGKLPESILTKGHAIKIMTGAPVPEGSDSVVMREDVIEKEKEILVLKECKRSENIRYRGEDIKKGEIVLKKDKKIFPADIGVMASMGRMDVLIYTPPVVGILPTGDELIKVNEKLKPGKVRDSNSYSISAQINESGAEYRRYNIVRDNKDILRKEIRKALDECDILLMSGGISVGDYDYVKEILEGIGAKLLFWRVNQKPGKPLAFLTYKNKFIFGLPGNPVSVMVCFEMYVRPLIKRLMGDKNLFKKKIIASSGEEYEHKKGRTDFARVKFYETKDGLIFKITGMQGSGILTSMSVADGIAIFPDDINVIKKGSKIEVLVLK